MRLIIYGLRLANIILDRKIPADLAARDAGTFNQIVAAAKETIGTHAKTGAQPA